MSESFDVHWLALREPFDHAARHAGLAGQLVAALPKVPWLVDLGAGTGSLFRYLAPLIGGDQSWTLIDADAELLDEAFNAIGAWAIAHDWEIDPGEDTMRINTPGGEWQLDGELHDLAAMPGDLPFREADAVVCSALLDIVSRGWLMALAENVRQPFYAALSVDGRDVWRPPHPADRIVRAGFRRDQARDKGFGRALGPDAASVALRAFAARGFAVASAPSDWVIPGKALIMSQELALGHADAAQATMPAQAGRIADWLAARRRQSLRGRLAIRIGHRDILALPPKG